MYAQQYGGFGPTNNSQPFNPNGPQTPHQQLQQPGQPQHMMYNPQAYSQSAAPYGTGGAAGGMGMMQQNSGLAHVPGGPMAAQYQTPYTSSPYGANIPTSTASNLPQNYMNTTSNGPAFPMMNAPNMNPMNPQNRMQPPPPSSTPVQRASPYGLQGTPLNASNTQSQFSTPQSNPTNIQTSNQVQGGSGGTPQTPNFPPGAGGIAATPLSPGSESREKERVTVLLYINSELLMESARLQAVQTAEKEKDTAAAVDGAPKEDESVQKERAERVKVLGREYVECMRRLQGNLAYLAAIADRSHKPSSQIPAHPQIISAPPLTSRSKPSSSPKASPKSTSSPSTSAPASASNPNPEVKLETSSPSKPSDQKPEKETDDAEKKDGPATGIGELDDVDRPERLKELYRKLQALFPEVDLKKEQTMQQINAAAMRARQAQAQQQAQQLAQVQGQGQGGGQGGGVA